MHVSCDFRELKLRSRTSWSLELWRTSRHAAWMIWRRSIESWCSSASWAKMSPNWRRKPRQQRSKNEESQSIEQELTNQKRELIRDWGKWFYSIHFLIDCTYHFVNKYFDKILNWKRFVIAYYSFPFLHFKNLLLLWSIKSKKKLEAIKTGSWISKRAAQRHKCKLLSVSHWTKNTKQASKGKKI